MASGTQAHAPQNQNLTFTPIPGRDSQVAGGIVNGGILEGGLLHLHTQRLQPILAPVASRVPVCKVDRLEQDPVVVGGEAASMVVAPQEGALPGLELGAKSRAGDDLVAHTATFRGGTIGVDTLS